MTYVVKIIVYTVDDSNVLEIVREAVEAEGARVQELTSRSAAVGERELYIEILLSEAGLLGGIIRRVEAVKGAAIMAAGEPELLTPPKKIEG